MVLLGKSPENIITSSYDDFYADAFFFCALQSYVVFFSFRKA
jgi:hypothetical protein